MQKMAFTFEEIEIYTIVYDSMKIDILWCKGNLWVNSANYVEWEIQDIFIHINIYTR